MKTLFKFILLTGFRDKIYLGMLVILLGVFGISNLVGFSALSEESQMQMVYFAFLSRIVLTCGMILFICFYISKSFENREVDFILSKPISRTNFILSYWLSFNLIAFMLLIPVVILMLIFNSPNIFGFIWWCISIILEIMMVSTFAIVASLILNSSVISIMSTICFYIVARMMGFFVYSVSLPKNAVEISTPVDFANGLLKFLSSVFPRLDLFAKSEWLIYGITNYKDIYIVLIQSAIYIIFLLMLAFYDFRRKQF